MTSNCKPETQLLCLKGPLWKRCGTLPLAFYSLVILSICGPVVAQTQDSFLPQEARDDSRYTSELPTDSGFNLDLQSKVIHDNNIFSNDAHRQSDNVFQEGALLNVWKTKPLWSVGLQYQPTILLYQTATAFNALDQGLKLDGNYRVLPHLQFRWSESIHYTTGALESAPNEYVSLPNGPPPSLNSTLITPLIRELANQSGLELMVRLQTLEAMPELILPLCFRSCLQKPEAIHETPAHDRELETRCARSDSRIQPFLPLLLSKLAREKNRVVRERKRCAYSSPLPTLLRPELYPCG